MFLFWKGAFEKFTRETKSGGRWSYGRGGGAYLEKKRGNYKLVRILLLLAFSLYTSWYYLFYRFVLISFSGKEHCFFSFRCSYVCECICGKWIRTSSWKLKKGAILNLRTDLGICAREFSVCEVTSWKFGRGFRNYKCLEISLFIEINRMSWAKVRGKISFCESERFLNGFFCEWKIKNTGDLSETH